MGIGRGEIHYPGMACLYIWSIYIQQRSGSLGLHLSIAVYVLILSIFTPLGFCNNPSFSKFIMDPSFASNIKCLFFLLFSIFGFQGNSISQNIVFNHIGVENGLSQNSVLAIQVESDETIGE